MTRFLSSTEDRFPIPSSTLQVEYDITLTLEIPAMPDL